MVGEKSIVLGSEERVDEDRGDFGVAHRAAALFAKLSDQLAVFTEHLQRSLQLHRAQLVDVGQVSVAAPQQAASGERAGQKKEQHPAQ